MKFSDFHPNEPNGPQWAQFPLEKQSIFHMLHIGAKKCEKCEILWNLRKKVKACEICGILWKSAKSAEFTQKCETCENHEN